MNQPPSPFDALLLRLSAQNMRGRDNPPSNLELLVYEQLQLLRAAYISLFSIDFHAEAMRRHDEGGEAALEDLVFGLRAPSSAATLHYNTFVALLNRFNEALKKLRGPAHEDIPGLHRLKFYRDKVTEHWVDYVHYMGGHGFTWREGKAPILSVMATARKAAEFTQARDDLVRALGGLGISISIPDDLVRPGMTMSEDYAVIINAALDSLGPRLHKKSTADPIVRILFRLGFPSPIQDMEQYCMDLLAYLEPLVSPAA
ncbi:MAG: hypothetical protein HMLKMBBP_03965 [Planctomycetes bacterium]|nr:hypothetical protein [Planctomycetota bacterium]